jgi:hypothetical protein
LPGGAIGERVGVEIIGPVVEITVRARDVAVAGGHGNVSSFSSVVGKSCASCDAACRGVERKNVGVPRMQLVMPGMQLVIPRTQLGMPGTQLGMPRMQLVIPGT